MSKKTKISSYHTSLLNLVTNYIVTVFLVVLFSPVMFFIFILIKLIDNGPIFFKQKRNGINGHEFTLIKFRTMKVNASAMQMKYLNLNEADGPVFKIYDDPRFTKIGKLLSRTGMDELPQFFNILKNEMRLVGPRPLPMDEAKKLTKDQRIREMVKPGIISTWVTNGSHKLKFAEWMRLDKEYVENATLLTDLKVIKDSSLLIVKSIVNLLL